MASNRGIARVLAVLHELFPTREITPATLDAWEIVFGPDWTDEELRECAIRAAKEPGRSFFPAPGDIIAHRPRPAIDIDALKRQIERLGHYNPNTGWILPTTEAVRAELGDGIAGAYAQVGERLFSDNPTTASIADSAFREGMAAVEAPPTERLAGAVPKQITEG